MPTSSFPEKRLQVAEKISEKQKPYSAANCLLLLKAQINNLLLAKV
jgi:hypothetical protein